MLSDSFVQKVLETRRLAQCFPAETIFKAATWLEEKHRQAPHWKTAAVIALHYLVLAMRPESQSEPERAKEYFRQAVLWRKEANYRFAEESLLTEDKRENQ